LVGLVLASLPAQAAEPTPGERIGAAAFVSARLLPDTTLERFLLSARENFASLDANGDGVLDNRDNDILSAIRAASFRSGAIAQLMRADLDNDGAVTADELRTLLRFERRMRLPATPPAALADEIERAVADIERVVAEKMKWDADGDGRISLAEAHAALQAMPTMAVPGAHFAAQILPTLMVFDADGNGELTRPELEAAFEAYFRVVDTDQNGIVSREELAAYRSRPDEPNAALRRAAAEAASRRDAAARERCALPKASPAAKIVVLGVYETEALSRVALGSPDKVTHAGIITVETGTEPLYLVIASYAGVIWQFTGAVDRIERVVLSSLYGNGATGLPAERLKLLPVNECLSYFYKVPSDETAKVAAQVERDIGRPADLIAGNYEVAGFVVPSGIVQSYAEQRKPPVVVLRRSAPIAAPGDGPAVAGQTTAIRNLEQELRRFSPGGVAEIDAAQVVSQLKATPYDVLPQQAGLLQLMRSGALTQTPDGAFLIHQKIRYPAGLAGAHSVRFQLPRGVPRPAGDPAHSRVITEDAAKPAAN